MEKILISSCLLGGKVRYHGEAAQITHPLIARWTREKRLVPLCPEVHGGMSTPRAPSEIVGAGGGISVLAMESTIINTEGVDVTSFYIKGANIAIVLAKQHKIKMAILKENSPSCGSHFIYDGSFAKNKIEGMGVTASLLSQNSIRNFSEDEIEEAEKYLQTIEPIYTGLDCC